MKKEVWRAIPSMPGHSASSLGRIKSHAKKVRFVCKAGVERRRLKKEKILSPGKHNGNYLLLRRSRGARTVHSLVAEAFYGPRPAGLVVCHNNGKRKDNRAQNLRYATRKENLKDMVKHGTVYAGATQAKLSKRQVKQIRALKALSHQKLAVRFGVTDETIRRIQKFELWKYIK